VACTSAPASTDAPFKKSVYNLVHDAPPLASVSLISIRSDSSGDALA